MPLDFLTPDKHGFIPNRDMLGREFVHSGNGRAYRILGFSWFCDTDEWAVRYEDAGTPEEPHEYAPSRNIRLEFVRTAHNFFGMRTAARFTRLA